ncbi:MAG: DUF4405 domain-containing protein [Desulfamplus sp.]|nr:DUF4405 domain-containing protein [Desulfamplus sp.]
MNIRKVTSLTAFISFFVVVVTSIILYIAPQGRVAYWADWKLFGLSKDQWGDIHINVGFLFLLFLLLHIYYNWNPIVIYLKNRSKELVIFTKEFNVALILTIIFIVGTYIEIPPFSTIINISTSIKDAAAVKYGEPPYGHAELSSLTAFAKKMNIDSEGAIKSIKDAGYIVDNGSQTLQEIATINKVAPQQLYLVMSAASDKSESTQLEGHDKASKLPENPPAGTGSLTLGAFCKEYNLDTNSIISSLNQANIKAKEEMTIKSIAEENKLAPLDLYERLRAIVGN